MNILFFITPKCDCLYFEEDDTLRQALEKIEHHRFSAVPLLNKNGHYIGTVTEGDLLWFIKNELKLNLKEAENIPITSIPRRLDYRPISISARMEDLSELALVQNFVPVSDDNNAFIGIVTRQEIIKHLRRLILKRDKKELSYKI